MEIEPVFPHVDVLHTRCFSLINIPGCQKSQDDWYKNMKLKFNIDMIMLTSKCLVWIPAVSIPVRNYKKSV